MEQIIAILKKKIAGEKLPIKKFIQFNFHCYIDYSHEFVCAKCHLSAGYATLYHGELRCFRCEAKQKLSEIISEKEIKENAEAHAKHIKFLGYIPKRCIDAFI